LYDNFSQVPGWEVHDLYGGGDGVKCPRQPIIIEQSQCEIFFLPPNRRVLISVFQPNSFFFEKKKSQSEKNKVGSNSKSYSVQICDKQSQLQINKKVAFSSLFGL
jgi:hypothetical protein